MMNVGLRSPRDRSDLWSGSFQLYCTELQRGQRFITQEPLHHLYGQMQTFSPHVRMTLPLQRLHNKHQHERLLSEQFIYLFIQYTLINISAVSIHVNMPALAQLLNFIRSPKAGTMNQKNSYIDVS